MAGLTDVPNPSDHQVFRAWLIELVDALANVEGRLKLVEAKVGWAVSMLENEVILRLAEHDRQIATVPEVVDRVMSQHDAVLKAQLDRALGAS